MARIESLLSARLFLAPQAAGDRIFFISNLSGRLSLYSMDEGGSVPEPLIPPHIALQNPYLVEGASFVVFPKLGKILVMIDSDGDENYEPMFVPLNGGLPEPAFPGAFESQRAHLVDFDLDRNVVYIYVESRTEPISTAFRGNLETGVVEKLDESPHGALPVGADPSHAKVAMIDVHGTGDHVLYLVERGVDGRRVLIGVPPEDRRAGVAVPPNGISTCSFLDEGRAILFLTSLWSDAYGLGHMELDRPGEPRPVSIEGAVHEGTGELEAFRHVSGDRYAVSLNVDGSSWLYEAAFDESGLVMALGPVLCGRGELEGGVLESFRYDDVRDRYVLSFSSATSPTQIYAIEGPSRDRVRRCTHERVLGVPDGHLASGEDASYASFDGLRVSARLYFPAPGLGFDGPRPLVYYIHGGPQSQERPDFAWFSMPLIQFLTLSGFAVFVPNVRGSAGYGLAYMRLGHHDWGGDDTLDHVHAMTEVLPKDHRIDARRAGVVGRSYGGFMTLTLASRHPQLWSAAVDMFGPYDLIGFAGRVPEAWKPYNDFLLGNPETEADFLIERSPRTFVKSISCPLLVVQGKNDPRVLEIESRELVETLRGMGKDVDYLMFEDEGHDVLKFENRVRCYNAITDFFVEHLGP